jgi:rare lipoprotein A
LTRWGVIAAIAATIAGAGAAKADEASVKTAMAARPKSGVVGVSSYYGADFHGRRTADGEIFDMRALTAASKSLPIPCYARVTNLRNGRSVVVRVNDRGPYVGGRMLDVSERVAKLLGYHGGLERVRLEYLGKAGPAGAADQRALLASLNIGARAKPADEGISVAERSQPALGYAEQPSQAPAAAALAAAVRPPPPPPEALGLAARLDVSVRRLEAALEAAHQTAESAARSAADSLSPYGQLVIAPFKPIIEASR